MANSGTTPSLKPSRSLSTSNTARWEASSMPTGHLGVHHRPDHAQGQYPEQCEAVRASCCRKRHQLANVDESADRRDDSQSGWLDLAGVVIVVLVAFGVFFLGLAATNARVGD
jgi:hypothetical protein